MPYFSQRDEEPYILDFFEGFVGRFLDVGAYDGKTFSTTRALALKGWGGVLIEPSPSILPALHAMYDGDNRYEIIECGIGVKTEQGRDFFDFGGDAVSSFDLDHVALWEEKGKRKSIKIPMDVLSVDDLFEKIGFEFDFLNLDAEAWSINILEVLPFDKLGTLSMICVEFDHQVERVMKIVEPHGFAQYHRTAENLLLTR